MQAHLAQSTNCMQAKYRLIVNRVIAHCKENTQVFCKETAMSLQAKCTLEVKYEIASKYELISCKMLALYMQSIAH